MDGKGAEGLNGGDGGTITFFGQEKFCTIGEDIPGGVFGTTGDSGVTGVKGGGSVHGIEEERRVLTGGQILEEGGGMEHGGLRVGVGEEEAKKGRGEVFRDERGVLGGRGSWGGGEAGGSGGSGGGGRGGDR